MIAFLKRWLFGPEEPGGLGQSWAEEARWVVRYRRCRKLPIVWRRPTREEAQRWEQHPVFGCFADDCDGLAQVDGRRWLLMERMFCGYPDPPRYVWLALDGEAVWAAAEFDQLPRAWTLPPGGAD